MDSPNIKNKDEANRRNSSGGSGRRGRGSGGNRRNNNRRHNQRTGGAESMGRQFENLLVKLLRIDKKTGATATVTFEAAVQRGQDCTITTGNFDCSLNPKTDFIMYQTMARREALSLLSSSMAVVVRVFHPELPRKNPRKPVKRVYGFMVHPNTDVIIRLTPEENQYVQCMDNSTGVLLPPEESVEYC